MNLFTVNNPYHLLKYLLFLLKHAVYIYIYIYTHTGCHRKKGPNFGRVFLMLNYTDTTQNTYIHR